MARESICSLNISIHKRSLNCFKEKIACLKKRNAYLAGTLLVDKYIQHDMFEIRSSVSQAKQYRNVETRVVQGALNFKNPYHFLSRMVWICPRK